MKRSRQLRGGRRRRFRRRSAARRAMVHMLRGGLLAALVLILCVGAVVARLSFGSISAEALAEPISRALNERLAPGWTAHIAQTGIAFTTHGPALLSEGIEIRQPDGTLFLSARAGEIAVDPWRLAFGDVDVTAIAFSGIDARLTIMPDGSLRTDAGTGGTGGGPAGGSAPAPAAAPEGTDGPPDFDAAVVGFVNLLSDQSGLARALDSISLSDARVAIADSRGEERARFGEVAADLKRTAPDAIAVSLSARGAAGPWKFSGAISGLGGTERVVDLAVEGARLADLLMLANANQGPISGDLAFSGRARVSVSADDRLTGLTGSVESAPGTFIYRDKDQPPLHVARFRLGVEREAASGDLVIPALGLDIGGARFDVGGRVRFGDRARPWRLQLDGRDAVLPPLTDNDEALAIDNLSLDLAGEEGGRLRIERIAASGAGFGVALNGELGGRDNPGGLRLGVQTARSDARAILRFWPAFVTPEPRRYLIENLSEGVLETLNVAVSLSAEQLAASRRREPLPAEVARTQFSAVDVTLQAAPGFPPLTDMTIGGLVTGATAAITASTAKAEVVPGQVLDLTDGRMAMQRLTAPINAAIDFRMRGQASALAHLLQRDALRPIFNVDVAPGSVQGAVDLAVSVSLPLIKQLTHDQVVTRATGKLNRFAIDIGNGRDKLTDADLSLVLDDSNLTLAGSGQLAGLPATLDLRQPLRRGQGDDGRDDNKGEGRAAIVLTLDDAARAARGFDLGNRLRGPVGVRIDTSFGNRAGKNRTPMKVDVDLARARIDDLLPGWSKAAGKPGRLSFSALDDNGFVVSDIVLDAGAAARGSARFDPGGSLKSASLTGVRLSPNDDLSLEIAGAGAGYRITARGNLLDARPFLKAARTGITGGAGGGAAGGKAMPDLDIDLAVNILAGFSRETLSKATLRLGTRKGGVGSLDLKGSFSGAPFGASLAGKDGRIEVNTANAGAMLRFADLYAHLSGGSMQAYIAPDGGQVMIRDFAIRNEPTMAHLLTESPSKLPVDPGNVPFTKLRAAFTRAPDRINIQEGVLWGPGVGVTFEGNLDTRRETIDLSGTYVPAYALNNMFSQVPLIGPLLGGGQYEGLFAVNFRARGALDSPSVTVNPLSAIAPGIFRKFFDLGRADSGQTPPGQ
ncbi:YhdP family protein [Pseudochelatococcus sp. B33]